MYYSEIWYSILLGALNLLFFYVNCQEVGTIYTHHQKTVIVDADAGHNRRKILAFVGGLDLCLGRYDTPHHPLFRTLETVHRDDYHNPNLTVNASINYLNCHLCSQPSVLPLGVLSI